MQIAQRPVAERLPDDGVRLGALHVERKRPARHHPQALLRAVEAAGVRVPHLGLEQGARQRIRRLLEKKLGVRLSEPCTAATTLK